MSAAWESHKPQSKFSWASVKEYLRGWWTRHVIDDYDNLWPNG